MTDEEKKELEALRAKAEKDLTDDEKAKLEALVKMEKAEAAKTKGDDKTYSESYVKSLREENAKYRTKARDAEKKLGTFDNIDPEEYQRLKDLEKEAQDNKLKAEGEWDTLRQQLIDDHGKELGNKDEEIDTLKTQVGSFQKELDNTILSHEIAVQATVAKAINPQLVEMVAMSKARVELLEDGKRVIRVLDASGNDRKDFKTGEPLTVAQLMTEMKEDEPTAHLFYGANPGAGSNTVKFDGKSVQNPWKKETFNLTLQGNILKQNPALANRLKEEAGIV
jgi:hypothetical protein